jgi:hypothetical protein
MTNSPWHPIAIPAVRDAAATPYGFMIDHLWAAQGTNIARRPHWPAEMFICVWPFMTDEIAAMGEWAMSHGVFFDNDLEYGSPVGDMEAADWLVGRVDV